MKRFWIAIALLVLVFCATLYNTQFLKNFTGDLSDLLTRAEVEAEREDWDAASKLTERAFSVWTQRDSYLHTMLRHSDIDGIHTGFQEVREFISCEESGEYSAANARLITQINMLYEAEQFTLKNIF